MKNLIALLLSCIYVMLAAAQVSITSTGTAYTQDFNTLSSSADMTWTDNSTLANWYAYSSKGTLTTLKLGDGSTAAGSFYNYGTSGSSDRALGSMNSNNDFAFGVRMKNNSGGTINAFQVTYNGEQWRNSRGGPQSLSFSYRISSSAITSLSSGTWNSIGALDFTSPITGGSATSLDGNASANRTAITYVITGISVADGQEIMFRWYDVDDADKSHGLAIDDISITPLSVTTYYSKNTSDISSLSNWGTATNGTGSNPASFTADNQVFDLRNSTSFTISANWCVSGSASKIIIGDGSTTTNFTIPSTYYVNGTIDVANGSTLTINNTTLPTIGNLGTNSTVIYGASGSQNLTGRTYQNLTIGGSGVKTLTANASINGTLSLGGGQLSIGNYQLQVVNGGTVSGYDSTKYIITGGSGSLKMYVAGNNTNVFFPVGKSTGYCPATVKLTNSSTDDYFTVRVADKMYASYDSLYNPTGVEIGTGTVNCTWFIEEEVAGGSSATLTLSWRGRNEKSGFSRSSCTIAHYTNGSWSKADFAASSGTDQFSRTITGYTTFSPFGMSGSIGALPVQLIDFSAVVNENEKTVHLKWSTASEINNKEFQVERSIDGISWEKLTSLEGHGTSQKRHDYLHVDRNAFSLGTQIVYYRLQQVDFNGRSEYSEVLSTRLPQAEVNTAKIWQSPSDSRIHVGFSSDIVTPVNFELIDCAGKIVLNEKLDPGSTDYAIDKPANAHGVYLIGLGQFTGEKQYKKVIIE